MFTREDLDARVDAAARILPTRGGVLVIAVVAAATVVVSVHVSLLVGSLLPLYLFAPPPLVGLALVGYLLTPRAARRRRRAAARALRGSDAPGSMPAWVAAASRDSFPETHRHLDSLGLSAAELDCVRAFAFELSGTVDDLVALARTLTAPVPGASR